jgi:uncharacterized protein YigA (DUF484 family)
MNETDTTTETAQPPRTEMRQLAESIAATANENVALKERLAKADKDLANANSARDMYSKMVDDKTREIDGLHAALDCMPNHPPRTVTVEGRYANETTLTLSARMMCWLAGMLHK